MKVPNHVQTTIIQTHDTSGYRLKVHMDGRSNEYVRAKKERKRSRKKLPITTSPLALLALLPFPLLLLLALSLFVQFLNARRRIVQSAAFAIKMVLVSRIAIAQSRDSHLQLVSTLLVRQNNTKTDLDDFIVLDSHHVLTSLIHFSAEPDNGHESESIRWDIRRPTSGIADHPHNTGYGNEQVRTIQTA